MTVLSYCPESLVVTEIAPTVSSSVAGSIDVRARFDVNTRRWQLSSTKASLQEKNDILSIWEETGGGAESFDWAPPDEPLTKVEFVEQSLSLKEVSLDRFSVSFELEEVY